MFSVNYKVSRILKVEKAELPSLSYPKIHFQNINLSKKEKLL